MKILTVSRQEVQQLLTMEKCIPIMRETLKNLAEAKFSMPLRSVSPLPNQAGVLATMPAFLLPEKIMGLKIISVFPHNFGTEFDSHQGAVMLFGTEHGQPLAIIDAAAITGIRTAAVSAVATDLLAKKNAHTLALLGSGVQATAHLHAISIIRKIEKVNVWSVPLDHAQRFVNRESLKYNFPISAYPTSSEAVSGADIICTITPSQTPILFGKDLKSGMHINAIGACSPTARELDTEAVVRSRMFVDLRESTVHEAGDFLIPKEEGALDGHHILGEIGGLLAAGQRGRKSESDITLFKSLGLAVEDIAAAYFVYREAIKKKMGTYVDL